MGNKLRNAINQSIKGLVNEQGSTGNGRAVSIINCTYNGSQPPFTPGNSHNMTINGIAPVVGDVIYHWNSAGGTHPAHGNLMKIMSVNPPDTSEMEVDYPRAVCSGNGWDYGCVDPSATNFDPNVSSIPTLLNAYAHVRTDCSGQDAWAAQNTYGNPGFLQHVDLSCCRYEGGDEDRGCMDPNALNYNECCDTTDPNCIPNIDTKECCRYEGGTEDKGCMDPNATNYNVCCDGDPNCTVIGPNPECCRYEHEPDPCKTNPKECWFCKGAGVPCIQFSQTSAAWTAAYTGIKYPTQADCMTNSDCGERGGELEYCQCCNGGNAQSMSQQVPIGTCSSLNGGVNNLTNCQPQQSQPINCKNPLPTIDPGLFEEIKRYKQLI